MDVIKLYSSQEESINVHSSQNGLDSETSLRIAYFDENSTRLKKKRESLFYKYRRSCGNSEEAF